MNNSNSIYLDHQASTPVDIRVLEKMFPYFREKAGNPHSSEHSVGWKSFQAVSEAKQSIANLIGADQDEIIFVSGATEANNLALLGLGKSQAGGKRKRILVSAIEHKCVLATARILEEQFGYQVEKIPVDKDGLVSVSALESALDGDVLAVSIMAVNNEIGTIQDSSRLSSIAREAGAIFHCDAAQAPLAIDMDRMAHDVDLLSLSGHKMCGPQGIGVLYVRRDLQEKIEPLIYGGGQQNGLRSGTLPLPLCVGMGTAAELISNPITRAARTVLSGRRDRFIEKMQDLQWEIKVNGPPTQLRHPGNANIRFFGFSAGDILNSLQPRLAASTGSACTSGIPEPSHVLRAIGLTTSEADSSLRFSLGFETSDEEVDEAVHLINDVLDGLSKSFLVQMA